MRKGRFGGGGGVALVDHVVTQNAHGFTVGTTIKPSPTGWVKTKADTAANAGTVAIVSEVIDVNNFKFIEGGLLPGNYTLGACYFLSTTTAGAIFIQSDPEVWELGNVREFIGTGVEGGLMVEIDAGDEITEYAFEQIQADWVEDIAFEFCDVVAGTAKTYTLDIKASFGYTIEAACLETDNGTLTGVSVKIGSTAVTGLSSLTVDTSVDETASTGAKTVEIGDRVYLIIAATYTGTPTLIRGKLKIKRS